MNFDVPQLTNNADFLKLNIYRATDPAMKVLSRLMKKAEAEGKLSITYFDTQQFQSEGVSPYNLIIKLWDEQFYYLALPNIVDTTITK